MEAPTGFDDKPADIHEAERQLERLIDKLAAPIAPALPAPAAPSSGAKPDDEAEWGLIERELLAQLTPKLKALFDPLWKYRNAAVKWKELRDAYSGAKSDRAI